MFETVHHELPIKVDQTYFSSETEYGNCLQAAVATLFDIPLQAVPDLRPNVIKPFNQGTILRRWLRPYNMTLAKLPVIQPCDGYYIACGPVARSDRSHAVVMCNGSLYHDPHPSRAGLVNIRDIILFYPLKPKIGV